MGLGAALLGFVCLIEQRIWAHHEPSPQPSIWAVPGSVVSTGSAVTIFCRTPPGVTKVRLQHEVPSGMWRDSIAHGKNQEVFEFSLQNMMHINAGIYSCTYHKGGKWTHISGTLQLIVTGVYKEKPSLAVDSGPKGFSERNVTLVCHTDHFFEIFILCRGGNASFPQNCLQQDHNTFPIFPLSPGHRRTYRCFGSFKMNSYLWSLPSDPLELSVPGPSVSSIVVWVTVAAVCFFIFLLLICLWHHWAKCKTSSSGTRIQAKYKSSAMDTEEKIKYGELECTQPENCSQVDAQLSPVEDSTEVTYAQLCQDILLEHMDSPPFKTLEGRPTHETCVYATLRLSQEGSPSEQ
ncbi:natural cytotoxicity triggering receptor 1-like isoform X4 [Apodemus sylvaticus]|uniref:natural cytotoxicity triggering receptor 1-like isoform X4 n=1 Tax=Apodemus sylvaticus TaxID=10129 RepID=UPI002241C2B9|nr:natural cytotoxicity triggering receptor 1-like isoform X4 [Apodemus sylvaticus]